MDLEYWKQRALEAEQSLKEGAGTAADTVRRGVDMGKAKLGFDNNEPVIPQITEPAGRAVGEAADAVTSKAGDLKTLFLDTLVPPSLDRPQPGQRAEPPGPSLNRPQPGQRVDAPGDMERALAAAEEAFNSVMKGAGSYADSAVGAVGDAVGAVGDAATAPFKQFSRDVGEGFHTELMNKALERNGMPRVPFRDRDDPYFGREYPHLTRPQPGQDWQPPGEGPIRGEELGWPYYIPQIGEEGRPKAPIRPEFGGPNNPLRRT